MNRRSDRNNHDMPMPGQMRAFTLVEVAIVLVIIGLIMGGVFKGQALIDSARVRSMHTQLTGIQTAWLSFRERYRAIPGDFARSDTQIDSAATPGNGNGQVDGAGERAGVWQQLALAGFINGHYDGSPTRVGTAMGTSCATQTCPRNPFSGYYKFNHGSQAANVESPAHELYTGDQVPVNILSQLDARLDDGNPLKGRFRVHRAFADACTHNDQWDLKSANANCAAVLRE